MKGTGYKNLIKNLPEMNLKSLILSLATCNITDTSLSESIEIYK